MEKFDYGTSIRNLREKLGITQAGLAEKIGVSFPTVNRWENGKTEPSPLSWSKIKELASHPSNEAPADPVDSKENTALDFTADPKAIRAVVEGERLSFGHLMNPAFAAEISSIDPLPHQRIAVYDHMLKQPKLRFLLADDAGAGKTIMSGLYIREMLSRRLLKRILIVPPAGLVGNWQSEMQVLFNLLFRVASGVDAKDGNPFVGPAGDRIIVSVDTLAGRRMFSRLQENEVKPYDLVVFDEAHKLSCDRGSDYRVRKTERYKLAEALAGVSRKDKVWNLGWHAHHLLLLTATPHMGKSYPYYALWRLLEPEVLTTPESFVHFPVAYRRNYFIRRTKEEMVRLDGSPLYPTRRCDTLGYELTQGKDSEQELYDETTIYLRYVYNKSKLLNQSAARLAMSVFQRRLASSTFALQRSFERRIEKLDDIIDGIRSGRLTIEQLLTLQRRIKDDDDVFESKSADEETVDHGLEENETGEDKILESMVAASLAELVAEREQVVRLRDLARRVGEGGAESKFDKLREIIADPRFAEEKLLVFTEHRDTLAFLTRRLGGLGYTGQITQIHGGMPYTERQEQIERFREPTGDGGARFMLCTDAAAEGVNLQFCWIMINYDIPWNPARLEQRMGRIHRYGQKHDPVVIVNLVAPSTREGRVLKTLLDKLEKIRKQLKSEKVFDSIGRVFSEISIKEYMEHSLEDGGQAMARKLDGQLTREQVKAIQDRERLLYGDGGDVKRELARLRESIEQETFFRLLPGYVRNFIASAAPQIGIEIDGDLDGYFTLQPQKRGAVDPLLQALESYPARQARRLSVLRPDDHRSCIWMHPGEPVFERFRELVRQHLAENALSGAVFTDPTAGKPYLFHLARLSVIRKADPDIAELAIRETVGYLLVGVRQSEGAEIALCPVEHLLLLRGGRGLPVEAQRLAAGAGQQRDQARAYLSERICRSMAVARRNAMVEVLPERETFVKRGYDYQEAELAAARAKLAPKARNGNKGAAAELSRIKTRQRELDKRRNRSLAIIRREPELLIPGEVDFIAHALVVPSTDTADLERHRADVEQVAMDMVKVFEEAAGAKVKLVHRPGLARAAGLSHHPGFDILSIRPNGERRCIEVKGRGDTGDVEITHNEWAKACNLRSEYWLYAVFHCATPTPSLVRIQDPFEKLLVRSFTKTRTVENVRVSHGRLMEVGEV